MDPVGPSGELVLDYSVHDAQRAGFSRVVFVIRRDFQEEFRQRVASRYEGALEVVLAFQEIEDLPPGFAAPAERTKPWGTGHAVWSARHAVNGPFLAVNADDFYGAEAFEFMARQLSGSSDPALVTYELGRTLSEHGAVARGVCSVEGGFLKSVEEHVRIARAGDGRIYGENTAGIRQTLDEQAPVSMNFWGFPQNIFPELSRLFSQFLMTGGLGNPRAEFYIPSAVNSLIKEGRTRVAATGTRENWFGVTYREDKARIIRAIAELVRQGRYPSPLRAR